MNSEERAADTVGKFETDTNGYKLRTMRVDEPRWNGAKREGMSLSAWFRGLIDKALKKS